MPIDINSITSHLFDNMPTKANRYEVRITGGNSGDSAPQDVTINCSGVTIPGKNLDFSKQKKYSMGLQSIVIDAKTYSEFNMTFYESEFEKERRYFSAWYDAIINPVTGRVNFYNDYIRSIEVIQYNIKGEVVYSANMIGCIPVNISGLERGYDKTDSIAEFSVSIGFYDIEETFYQRS